MHRFQTEGVGFRSMTENMDTTTPGGMLIFHVFAAMAQFERDLIRERTMAELSAARAVDGPSLTRDRKSEYVSFMTPKH
jgi:DNA invertase Pin-like site-specific DNA recombinase